MQICVSGVTP